MKFNIFLEDLSQETIDRIKWVLREDLKYEIEEAVERGIERETAESEAIDYYLNTHNFGIPIEL